MFIVVSRFKKLNDGLKLLCFLRSVQYIFQYISHKEAKY